MILVTVRENEPFEKALRRFRRKVEREGIRKDIKKNSFYLKPGERRRLKQRLAEKRRRKAARRAARRAARGRGRGRSAKPRTPRKPTTSAPETEVAVAAPGGEVHEAAATPVETTAAE